MNMNKSIDAFCRCLTLMALALYVHEDARKVKFGTAYKGWLKEAEPFLRKYGLLRDFVAESKVFYAKNMNMDEEDAAILHGKLKDKVKAMQSDNTISADQYSIIKDCTLYFKKDSEPAFKRISSRVRLLGDTRLTAQFLSDEEVEADQTLASEMAKIVQVVTGRRNDPILTLIEMRDNREGKFAKHIARYSELRKEFVKRYKAALLSFVRGSGHDLVPIQTAKRFLKAKGCDYLPEGFEGYVDELGALYTTKKLKVKGMLIGRVLMNPSYDPAKDNTYVCSAVGNKAQILYTEHFTASKKKERFDVVQNFAADAEKYRRKWLADLSSTDPRTKIAATMAEIIYLTQQRIGTAGNETDGKATFGLSTLQAQHIKEDARGALHFRYPGKKGTMQDSSIMPTTPTNKRVIAIVKQLLRGKRPTAHVFETNGIPVTARMVNAYLKSIGVTITAHKFRHLAGTQMALEILRSSPYNSRNRPTQTEAEKWIKEAFKAIGEKLKHRTGTGDKEKVVGTTAIAAYADPDVLKDWFFKLNLRTPKWLPKKAEE